MMISLVSISIFSSGTSKSGLRGVFGRILGTTAFLAMTMAAGLAQSGTNVVTYHNDPARTGVNSNETALTPANVKAGTFGAVVDVTLDDFVDAQPLVVDDDAIKSFAPNGVVYVGTEGNTVYAIDAVNGSILNRRNLGATVPASGGCTGPNIGIMGTPTIDLLRRTLFVMSDTLISGRAVYQLHALDLQTLADQPGSPVTVQATQTLQDGSSYAFNAAVQRQRPAMLESNGTVYVGFGSNCDSSVNASRGWVLGWNAATLAPLAGNIVTDRRDLTANTGTCEIIPSPCFLSAIWMSGFGISADPSGNLYFVTGNTGDASYDSTFNIAESAVKVAPDLLQTLDLFTPNNESTLDNSDRDFGSGGLLVLPDQSGPFPHLAVAAGKDGRMFVLNRDAMGGFQDPDVPNYVSIGNCWCGPSYLPTLNGGLVISSGGGSAKLWQPAVAGGQPSLSLVATAPAVENQPPVFLLRSHPMERLRRRQ